MFIASRFYSSLLTHRKKALKRHHRPRQHYRSVEMTSKKNDHPQSTNAKRGKSKGKTTGIQSQNVVEVGTLDALGKLVIAPDGTTGFLPSTESTNVAIMDSIKSFYWDDWTTWKEIPVLNRLPMWDHFRCTWYSQHDYQIFCNFEIQAASLLDRMIWTAWQKDQKPDWMLESIWVRLSEKWKKSQTVCIQERVAQASDKGDSLHTGGSVGEGTHRQRLEKKKGRTMTYDEVIEKKHVKNKKDGHRTLVEPHVERTNVGYTKSLDQWSQSQTTTEDDSSNQSSDNDEASILPEAIGGVHNLGSQRCVACQEEIDSLWRQVQALS
ncbi:hypothetical protein P3S67_006403 [Capsicum chacoense]